MLTRAPSGATRPATTMASPVRLLDVGGGVVEDVRVQRGDESVDVRRLGLQRAVERAAGHVSHRPDGGREVHVQQGDAECAAAGVSPRARTTPRAIDCHLLRRPARNRAAERTVRPRAGDEELEVTAVIDGLRAILLRIPAVLENEAGAQRRFKTTSTRTRRRPGSRCKDRTPSSSWAASRTSCRGPRFRPPDRARDPTDERTSEPGARSNNRSSGEDMPARIQIGGRFGRLGRILLRAAVVLHEPVADGRGQAHRHGGVREAFGLPDWHRRGRRRRWPRVR